MKSVNQNNILTFLICALLGYIVAKFLSGNGLSVGGDTQCTAGAKKVCKYLDDAGTQYDCPDVNDRSSNWYNMQNNNCNESCIVRCNVEFSANPDKKLPVVGEGRQQYCVIKEKLLPSSSRIKCGYSSPTPTPPPGPTPTPPPGPTPTPPPGPTPTPPPGPTPFHNCEYKGDIENPDNWKPFDNVQKKDKWVVKSCSSVTDNLEYKIQECDRLWENYYYQYNNKNNTNFSRNGGFCMQTMKGDDPGDEALSSGRGQCAGKCSGSLTRYCGTLDKNMCNSDELCVYSNIDGCVCDPSVQLPDDWMIRDERGNLINPLHAISRCESQGKIGPSGNKGNSDKFSWVKPIDGDPNSCHCPNRLDNFFV